MKYIYIAGPYSKGDTFMNIRHALTVAEELIAAGFEPYVPHLAGFWHYLSPHAYDYWMKRDEAWLLKCDALVRIPGESEGADKEVSVALLHSIPVLMENYDIQEVIKDLRLMRTKV